MVNPVWKNEGFEVTAKSTGSAPLKVRNVVNKAMICLFILVISTAYMWTSYYAGKGIVLPTVIAIGGGLAGFYVSFRVPEISVVTVPLFMILEGLTVGGVSALVEFFYPGVVLNAVTLTYIAALLLLLMSRFDFLTAGNRFFRIFTLAAGSIIIFYVLKFIMGIFSINILKFLSPIGMAICLAVVIVGSINLVNDMNFIREREALGIRKRAEWTAVLGIMVTVGWVYLEVARLLFMVKRFISGQIREKKEAFIPDKTETRKTENIKIEDKIEADKK